VPEVRLLSRGDGQTAPRGDLSRRARQEAPRAGDSHPVKGLELLNEINSIRACRGKAPIARISLPGTLPNDPLRCPVAAATGATVTCGSHPEWLKRFVLVFDEVEVARAVSAQIGQPCAPDEPEVLASDAMVSFLCAIHFGLVFDDADGFLKGWIEPSDDDPSIWDLHLMPGVAYPRGHEPRPAAREVLSPSQHQPVARAPTQAPTVNHVGALGDGDRIRYLVPRR
jgi:hypothetical protein